VSQCKECVSEFCFEFRGERARRAHQKSLQTQRGASRLLNTLEEGLYRGGIESRVVEHSVELCQEGIEQMQLCPKITRF
jgi:hypothetical protein